MAVLKNKTQKNFTMISNNILRDKKPVDERLWSAVYTMQLARRLGI